MFTDIEGSTALLKRLRERYADVVSEHRRLLRAAFAAHGGSEVDSQGDSFLVAFRSAHDAVGAATDAQRALEGKAWPEGVRLRVRMGVHTGRADLSEGRYHGVAVHRGARIMAAAHGGQVVVSQTTHDLLADEETDSDGFRLRDLGPQRLKDFDRPVRLYQVTAEGLQDRFPPVRTGDTRRRRLTQTRRGRVVLAIAALVLTGVVAAAVVLATRPASARPVRLVANSVAVIDPGTNRIVGDVPISSAPREGVAGGRLVWVLNDVSDTATAIDPKSLKVVRAVGLNGTPSNQWSTGPTDWVALPGAVEMIGADGTATTIHLWRPPASGCPTFVTGGDDTV
jgi:class 3 adenylate cyclase